MSVEGAEAVLELDVEGVAVLSQQISIALRPVVPESQLEIRVLRDVVSPTANDIPASDVGLRLGEEERGLLGLPAVVVALKAQVIGVGELPVDADSAAGRVPLIVGRDPAPVVEVVAIDVLQVGAIVDPLRELAAVAHAGLDPVEVAAEPRDEESLGLRRVLRDDVDHPVDRVRAPQGSAGPAHHLDPIDVFEQEILDVPVDAGKERCVDAPAVDHHEQLVGELSVEAAGRDRPRARVDVGDVQAGDHPQQVGDVRHARATDVLARDHRDGGRSLRQRLGAFGHRGDLHLQQVLDAEAQEIDVILRARSSWWRQEERSERDHDPVALEKTDESCHDAPPRQSTWLLNRPPVGED